jgi:hypothetical protein
MPKSMRPVVKLEDGEGGLQEEAGAGGCWWRGVGGGGCSAVAWARLEKLRGMRTSCGCFG